MALHAVLPGSVQLSLRKKRAPTLRAVAVAPASRAKPVLVSIFDGANFLLPSQERHGRSDRAVYPVITALASSMRVENSPVSLGPGKKTIGHCSHTSSSELPDDSRPTPDASSQPGQHVL
jgi:hypothetical protein